MYRSKQCMAMKVMLYVDDLSDTWVDFFSCASPKIQMVSGVEDGLSDSEPEKGRTIPMKKETHCYSYIIIICNTTTTHAR